MRIPRNNAAVNPSCLSHAAALSLQVNRFSYFCGDPNSLKSQLQNVGGLKRLAGFAPRRQAFSVIFVIFGAAASILDAAFLSPVPV
jgi:hypothetical protein